MNWERSENGPAEIRVGVILVAPEPIPDALALAVRELGGYAGVESADLHDPAGLGQAAGQLAAAGVGRVLIAPLITVVDAGVREALEQRLPALREAHPQIEFIQALAPLDVESHARWLVGVLRLFEDGDPADGTIPLSQLAANQQATVQRLVGGNEFVSRLAALGFIPGAPIQAVQNYGSGPLIVAVRETRIALGRTEASKVRVRPVNGWSGHHHGRGRRRGRKSHHE